MKIKYPVVPEPKVFRFSELCLGQVFSTQQGPGGDLYQHGAEQYFEGLFIKACNQGSVPIAVRLGDGASFGRGDEVLQWKVAPVEGTFVVER